MKIENTVTPSSAQWEAIINGVRNPYASWDKSDSGYSFIDDGLTVVHKFVIGEKDLALMSKLARAGDDHGKFLRMIQVISNISTSLTVWKQLDTYKVGTVSDSTSTMHSIMNHRFSLEDFERHEMSTSVFDDVIDELNNLRDSYLIADDPNLKAILWQAVIDLLPESYIQMRTWSANYQVLRHIYHARKGHKLREWQQFREWIESLPYAKELIIAT